MKEDNQFYVYKLVNSLDGQPFYVGKGLGNRMYNHVNEAKSPHYKKKRSVHCKIMSIINKGGKVLYEKIHTETEAQAFEKERELIQMYGRKDLNTGILCNLTDGGEGTQNLNPQSIQKRISAHRGVKRSEEAKQNMKEAQLRLIEERQKQFGYKMHPDTVKKMTASRKGKPWSEKARNAKRRKPLAVAVEAYIQDTGEFVGKWDSISACAAALDCGMSSIQAIVGGRMSKSCSGKLYPCKSHKGYTFKKAV